jgi:hypothetical protein
MPEDIKTKGIKPRTCLTLTMVKRLGRTCWRKGLPWLCPFYPAFEMEIFNTQGFP